MADCTELWIKGWRRTLQVMLQLGLTRGFDGKMERTAAPPALSAAGPRGQLCVHRDHWVEIHDQEELKAVHLVWNESMGMSTLLEFASTDAVLVEGLGYRTSLEVRSKWQPGQERVVFIYCSAQEQGRADYWAALAALRAEVGGACRFIWLPTKRFSIAKANCGAFDGAVVIPDGERISLPNGMAVKPEEADPETIRPWVELVGMSTDEVFIDGPLGTRARQILHLASAHWASRNWSSLDHLEKVPERPEWAEQIARYGAVPELLSSKPKGRQAFRRKGGKPVTPVIGDLIACDSCSLAPKCRLARAGSVCVIPESDMGELAKKFRTRDVNTIITGLGDLLGQEADRVERYVAAERRADDEVEGGGVVISKEVTSMVHGLFDRGVKLAKLLDPKLSGGPTVAVNLTNNAVGAITSGSPQALMAAVVAELEAQGYRRDQITPELVMSRLGAAGGGPGVEAIESAVVVERATADPAGVLPEHS